MPFTHLMASLVVTAALLAGQSQAQDIEIPYEKFVLDNGLTLIVHEDHKVPIVAVNVWYHVGSKNENGNQMLKSSINIVRPVSKSFVSADIMYDNAMDNRNVIIQIICFNINDQPTFIHITRMHGKCRFFKR